MTRSFLTIILYGVLAVLSVGAGWILATARQDSTPAGEEAAAAEEEAGLSANALAAMNVTVAALKKTSYARTKRIQAVIEDHPLAHRPVTTPIGGIVEEIHVGVGNVVESGAPLLVIVRDSIPRLTLTLTGELLSPLSERIHETLSLLRSSRTQLEITTGEIARLRALDAGSNGGLPVVSRQKLVDLEYDQRKAQTSLANARRELAHHGLTEAEVDGLENGDPVPPNRTLWKRVLVVNGLWDATCDRILAALPESVGAEPWTVAAIGELAASGLADVGLATLVEESKAAARQFVDVAGLLALGSPPARVRYLAELGALEPRVVIRAPKSSVPFDVDHIDVREGERVEPGRELLDLYDGHQAWLRLEPVGAELALVTTALSKGTAFTAMPLVAGAGPVLGELYVARIAPHGEHGGAYAVVANQATSRCEPPCRTWTLRAGMRYVAALPLETYHDRFVLPRDAIARQGPERLVYMQNGKTFTPVLVTVEIEDEGIVVLADDGALFDGDVIAVSGAFDLALALTTKAGEGIDPHAGHSHD